MTTVDLPDQEYADVDAELTVVVEQPLTATQHDALCAVLSPPGWPVFGAYKGSPRYVLSQSTLDPMDRKADLAAGLVWLREQGIGHSVERTVRWTPLERATVVQHDDTAGEVLRCPHEDCQVVDRIALIDRSERVNPLSVRRDDDEPNGDLWLAVSEDRNYSFDTAGYVCMACDRPVGLPITTYRDVKGAELDVVWP